MMLQGITAQYLLHATYPVKAGETILVHAAAGGVGSILVQWAKRLGATVIGTVGNDDKAQRARALGCDHVIVYSREKFPERVRELTGGAGVAVVYDSVGRDTFLDSVACLQRRGTMVSYGNATGPVAPFDCALLHKAGSVYVTRPGLPDYIASRAELLERAGVAVRGGAQRPGEDRGPAALRAEGCRAGPPRPRGAQDHRLDGAAALSGARRGLEGRHARHRRLFRSSRSHRPLRPRPARVQGHRTWRRSSGRVCAARGPRT